MASKIALFAIHFATVRYVVRRKIIAEMGQAQAQAA
jgi:hypothetical protein